MGRPRKNVETHVVFKALLSPKQYFVFGEEGETFRAVDGVFTTNDAELIEFLSKNTSCWERVGGAEKPAELPPI